MGCPGWLFGCPGALRKQNGSKLEPNCIIIHFELVPHQSRREAAGIYAGGAMEVGAARSMSREGGHGDMCGEGLWK